MSVSDVVSPCEITVPDAAELADVTQTYIRTLYRDGVVEATYRNHRWYIDRASFDGWMASRRDADNAAAARTVTKAAHRIAAAAPRLNDKQKAELHRILCGVTETRVGDAA